MFPKCISILFTTFCFILISHASRFEGMSPEKRKVIDREEVTTPPTALPPPLNRTPPIQNQTAPIPEAAPSHQSADNSSTQKPNTTRSSMSNEAPAKEVAPSLSEIQNKKDAIELLAKRIADLFTCSPTHKDSDYSTQSWYLVNTLMSWNNSLVESHFTDNDASLDFKELFEKSASEQLKLRNPSLANSPTVQNYFKNASQSAEGIYKSAIQSKEKIESFSKATEVIKSTSRINGKNAFQNLKVAHTLNLPLLQQTSCTQLSKDFFARPTFSKASTQRAIAATKKPGMVIHKISELPPSLHKLLASEKEQRDFNSQIDKKYPRTKNISAELPPVKLEDTQNEGYMIVGKSHWARSHIIGNILKAAHISKKQKMVMGVGDFNDTKATLTLLNSSGNPTNCDASDTSCVDRGKTFLMLQALIDVDPNNIRRIEVSDRPLRDMLKDYLVKNHNYNRISADWKIRTNNKSSNSISFEWKD